MLKSQKVKRKRTKRTDNDDDSVIDTVSSLYVCLAVVLSLSFSFFSFFKTSTCLSSTLDSGIYVIN